jgi:hypothetical protein
LSRQGQGQQQHASHERNSAPGGRLGEEAREKLSPIPCVHCNPLLFSFKI